MKKIMTRLLSLVLLGTFIPSYVLAADWDLDKGSITVSATVESQTVSQAGGSPTVDHNPVITSSSGKTNNTVTITAERNATANVTLENVNIDTGTRGGAAIKTSGEGKVNIQLEGANTVPSGANHAGVEKKGDGTLTITDENKDGSLTATGGNRGAGIGGGKDGSGSNITIEGGEVTANGGKWAAGIGGGQGGSGSNITVSGGKVTANGGTWGAGIGGGCDGSGSGITISGGDDVKAKGGNYGAGIGGGQGGSGSEITVSSGNVTAQGGASGAGIGGGGMSSSGNGSGNSIAISGGKVEAIGGDYGAGIGGGQGGSGSGITVSDGEVTAQGGNGGAGIGGGEDASGNGITISGGQVTAMGGLSGAGIGGGAGKEEGSGNVTVSGEAQVKVKGGAERGEDICRDGAAIGNGGYYKFGTGRPGDEISPNINDLTVEGFIQYYGESDDIKTAAPYKTITGTVGDHSWNAGEVTTPATCTTPGVRTYTCTKNPAHTKTEPIPALNHLFGAYIYNNDATTKADGTETAKCERCNKTDTRTAKGTRLPEHTAETVPESKAAAYWVSDSEGQSIPYQAQQKDGVLTVTVQADTASLRGTTGSLGQLEAQGIAEIRFVTKGAQSAFTLADLLASGTGSFTLTHEAETVRFTLAEKDISGILK